MHDERIRHFNALAAADIFAHYNPKYQATAQRLTRCDLHGLHVDEARQYAHNHLEACRAVGVEKTMLIVGKGGHSQQGAARIKPAILDMLVGRQGLVAGIHEKNDGCIVVDFTPANVH